MPMFSFGATARSADASGDGAAYRARWNAQIHQEWMRNLLLNRPDIKRESLEKTRDMMNSAIPDGLVEDYQRLVPDLELTDADPTTAMF